MLIGFYQERHNGRLKAKHLKQVFRARKFPFGYFRNFIVYSIRLGSIRDPYVSSSAI